MRSVLPLLLASVALAACGGDDVAPSATRGELAFRESCAPCHASGDGFDLAFFGFDEADIVRRALKHVPEETGRDIAAYVRALGVTPVGVTTRLFQPGGRVASSEAQMWTDTFGVASDVWPAALTADTLRALDLRTLAVPVALPRWSSERTGGDWMPDTPLDAALHDADGGILRERLAAYRAAPDDASLVALVTAFQRRVGPDLCYGEVGAQPLADVCFEARRWMSSLAAMHFVRRGITEEIPIEVVRLWWQTGEASVSTNFVPITRRPDEVRIERTAAWLYLGFTYAPAEFREENSYLGQFLDAAGHPRLAMLTALRRMVADGRVHEPAPEEPFWDGQRFWDANLAVLRAPSELRLAAAAFVIDYLSARLNGGDRYRSETRALIESCIASMDEALEIASGTEPQKASARARLADLRERAMAAAAL